MNYKDIIIRTLKTFLQAFLGSMLLSLNNVTTIDEKLIKSALIGATTAGVCAVMNLIINYLDKGGEENV